MTWYDRFKALSDDIGRGNLLLAGPLKGMTDAQRKPIDRINDVSLIVLHVFAFEVFCLPYVRDVADVRWKPGGLNSGLLRELHKKAADQGVLDRIASDLSTVDAIMMIRHLYGHGMGRRSGLERPQNLPPAVLKAHHFKTDDPEDDLDAQWWPTRNQAFIACVGPVMALAEKISRHLAP